MKDPLLMTRGELILFLTNRGMFETKYKIGGRILESWNTPILTDAFCDKESNTILFEYYTTRISDGVKHELSGSVNFTECHTFVNNKTINTIHQSNPFKVSDFNWLIDNNFKTPLHNYK